MTDTVKGLIIFGLIILYLFVAVTVHFCKEWRRKKYPRNDKGRKRYIRDSLKKHPWLSWSLIIEIPICIVFSPVIVACLIFVGIRFITEKIKQRFEPFEQQQIRLRQKYFHELNKCNHHEKSITAPQVCQGK